MIFSDSPRQKALERMMTQIKGFPPRGSGVMVLRRFEYTAEIVEDDIPFGFTVETDSLPSTSVR